MKYKKTDKVACQNCLKSPVIVANIEFRDESQHILTQCPECTSRYFLIKLPENLELVADLEIIDTITARNEWKLYVEMWKGQRKPRLFT